MDTAQENKPFITDLPVSKLDAALADAGEPGFRTAQVMKWLYQKRVSSFDKMSNLSKLSCEKLSALFRVKKPEIVCCLESKSGDAVKFGIKPLHKAVDDHIIESVLLLDDKRRTACVSSQMGCALGCTFCETAKLGFLRNLSLAEILGQLIIINDYLESKNDHPLTNIVFMGMGEALFNFDVFCDSVEILTSENGFALAPWRITVSTAGVVPSIEKLIAANLGVRLAVSLNHYSNPKRDRIMPINKKYPIEQVMEASRRFAKTSRYGVTFEYVVNEGDNDGPDAINALVKMMHDIKCKVNLIPLNPAGLRHDAPGADIARIDAFSKALYERGITATVRKSRGKDICGACGQLAGRLKNAD